jgi:hypothetical protein
MERRTPTFGGDPTVPGNRVLALDGSGSAETGRPLCDPNADYTVECWAYLATRSPGEFREIASQDRQFYIGVEPGGGMRAGDSWLETGTPFPSLGWHHVAFVKHLSSVRVYLDGKSIGMREGISVPKETGNTFRIGRQFGPTGGEFWLGYVDDVRVWRTARTEAEIQANLLTQLSGNEPGLVALWTFEDGTGLDRSTNRNTARFEGSARVVPASEVENVEVFASPRTRPASKRIPPGAGTPGSTPDSGPPTGRSHIVLNGVDSYVELPVGIFSAMEEATVETWIRWDGASNTGWNRVFNFGLAGNDVGIGLNGQRVWMVAATKDGLQEILSTKPVVLREWMHVAAVFGKEQMALVLNGIVERSLPVPSAMAGLPLGAQNRIGKTVTDNPSDLPLAGGIAEFRVWRVARTVEEIRATMLTPLTGAEPGLAGLWNFQDGGARDDSLNRRDGTFAGGVTAVGKPPTPQGAQGSPERAPRQHYKALVSGVVRDILKRPVPGVEVFVDAHDGAVFSSVTGDDGTYFQVVDAGDSPVQIQAVREDLGSPLLSRTLVHGMNTQDFVLRDSLRLEGKLLDEAGRARSGVRVDAVRVPGSGVVAQAVTDADGRFRLGSFWDLTCRLRGASPTGMVELLDGKEFAMTNEVPVTNLLAFLHSSPLAEMGGTKSNRVLVLRGGEDFMSVPTLPVDQLREATIEAWVRFDRFDVWQRFFSHGTFNHDLYVGSVLGNKSLEFAINPRGTAWRNMEARDVLETNQWCHVALSFGPLGTALYLNGVQTQTSRDPYGFAEIRPGSPTYIGRESGGACFSGGIDEVRVWVGVRSISQIRSRMFERLTGYEPGLMALWNFDDPDNPGRDATPNGFHGTLRSGAHAGSETLPTSKDQITAWTRLFGSTVDANGRALARVRVKVARGQEKWSQESDAGGYYSFLLRPSPEPARITASLAETSALPVERALLGWEEELNLALRDLAPISGRVRTIDEAPIPGVLVQAVPETQRGGSPRLVLSTITDTRGRFRFAAADPGTYKLRAHVPGAFAPLDTGKDVNVVPGTPVSDLDFSLPPFKRTWHRHYSHADGLPADLVLSVFQAADGALWFGTEQGAARFDGKRFQTLAAGDGLHVSRVTSIAETRDGRMWFGTRLGVARWDPLPDTLGRSLT